MKTAVMCAVLVCLGLTTYAGIERQRHERAEDFHLAWPVFAPAMPPEENTIAAGAEVEYRLPGMRLAVAKPNGRRSLLRGMVEDAGAFQTWGDYPKADRYGEPLFAHGRIWLFAQAAGVWRLHSAALDAPSPEWRIEAEAFDETPLRFALDHFGEPILLLMSGDSELQRRGRFTGGGASIEWSEPSPADHRRWDASIPSAIFGEFDLGVERPLLGLSWKRGAAPDSAIRYRVSLDEISVYGAWSAWTSLDAVPLNRRGRFVQYQIRGERSTHESGVERFVEIAYWVGSKEHGLGDIEQFSPRGGSRGSHGSDGMHPEARPDPAPTNEEDEEAASEQDASRPQATESLPDRDDALQDSPHRDDTPTVRNSPLSDNNVPDLTSLPETDNEDSETPPDSASDPEEEDEVEDEEDTSPNRSSPSQSNPAGDGSPANASAAPLVEAASSPPARENDPQSPPKSVSQDEIADEVWAPQSDELQMPATDAAHEVESASRELETDVGLNGGASGDIPEPTASLSHSQIDSNGASNDAAPETNEAPSLPQSGEHSPPEASPEAVLPATSPERSATGIDDEKAESQDEPQQQVEDQLPEEQSNKKEGLPTVDLFERVEDVHSHGMTSEDAPSEYAANPSSGDAGDPLSLSASIRSLQLLRPAWDGGIDRGIWSRLHDYRKLDALMGGGAVSGSGRFAKAKIESASDRGGFAQTQSNHHEPGPTSPRWPWLLAALLLLLAILLRRPRQPRVTDDVWLMPPPANSDHDPWVEEIIEADGPWERVIVFRPVIQRIASSRDHGALLCANGELWHGPSPARLCDPQAYEDSKSWREDWRFTGETSWLGEDFCLSVGAHGVVVMPIVPGPHQQGRFYSTSGYHAKGRRIYFPQGVEHIDRLIVWEDQLRALTSQNGNTAIYTATLGRGSVHKWKLEAAFGELRSGPVAISPGREALCASPASDGAMRLVVHTFDSGQGKRFLRRTAGIVPYMRERLFIDSEGSSCFLIEDGEEAIRLQIIARDARKRLAGRYCCFIERPWRGEIVEAEVHGGRLYLLGREAGPCAAWRAASARLSKIVRHSSDKAAPSRMAV